MPHTLFPTLAGTLGHTIPLFLLTFGVVYLVLAFAFKPFGNLLNVGLPVAGLSIAAALAWLYVAGVSFGSIFLASDVLVVLGVGLVFVVLGRIFAG